MLGASLVEVEALRAVATARPAHRRSRTRRTELVRMQASSACTGRGSLDDQGEAVRRHLLQRSARGQTEGSD